MKFKCKASGTIIELFHEVDILTTLENPAYEKVTEEVKVEKAVAEKKTKAKE